MNLITNLKVRAKIITAIRDYFLQEGFLEVETPLLVPAPSTEPYLEVFETKLSTDFGRTKRAFLTTSPEYAMKKLLSMGSGSSFQICKSFRNAEGIGANHNHEFTILEWYRTPGDYEDVMTDVEGLMRSLVKKVGKDAKKFSYQGQTIDLESPWIRLSIAEAFERFVGLVANEVLDAEVLNKEVAKRDLSKEQNLSYDDLFQLLMLNLVEPNLSKTQPTFLYDYPATQAALARRKPKNPDWAERFEVFIGGLEIGNAFSELADADEQLFRMEADLKLRAALGKTQFALDRGLVGALKKGLPPTGGIAVGVDRLVMLLTDSSEISQVIAFPTAQLFALN